MSLTGKVAIITGSSKGIGKAIAQRLADDGCSVTINYTRDAAPADSLVREIGAEWAIAIKADTGIIKEAKELVEKTVERFGRLDYLVCNAAIMPMRDLSSMTEEEWERVYAVNVKGPMFLSQFAAPHLPPHSGRIIFFSSSLTHTQTIVPAHLLYLTTKGAIEQLTRVLSKDLARQGINVNCVAPGPIATDMFFAGKSEQLINFVRGQMPSGRLGQPEEVADVVRFLVGEEAKWVSGQTIRVNGGMI